MEQWDGVTVQDDRVIALHFNDVAEKEDFEKHGVESFDKPGVVGRDDAVRCPVTAISHCDRLSLIMQRSSDRKLLPKSRDGAPSAHATRKIRVAIAGVGYCTRVFRPALAASGVAVQMGPILGLYVSVRLILDGNYAVLGF